MKCCTDGEGFLLNLAMYIIPTIIVLREFQATPIFVRSEKIVLETKEG
jgi:hypothetical protein